MADCTKSQERPTEILLRTDTVLGPFDPSDPVIIVVTRPAATVTIGGTRSTSYTETRFPTNSAGSTISDPSATVTLIDFIPPSVSTDTAGSPFTCDKYGYLLDDGKFARVDLETFNLTIINPNFGYVGSLAYNVLDNYIYTNNGYRIGRVDVTGNLTLLSYTFASTDQVVGGEFDNTGQLYFLSTGSWYQVDLKPGSATYGTMRASGALNFHSWQFGDWVFYPNTGRVLWSYAINTSNSSRAIVKFDLSTHLVSAPHIYSGFTGGPSGEQFGAANGDLYWRDGQGDFLSEQHPYV
ncbi:hypothetical protein TWF694_005414 [Orbilia ellipsospora]|uniref:DUF6923 domain-containing protein n=1 Tax=Orbilia ellipsospora TaxID=2528407 RepID=A0AAV9WT31_9PEZI